VHLDIPKKLQALAAQAHTVAKQYFRPISRKYDSREHEYAKELDLLAAILDGMNDGDASSSAGASAVSQNTESSQRDAVSNGRNLATVLGLIEMSWGDVGLALTIPRQGLGNAAIAAVGTPEQRRHFAKKWVAMAITEPAAGSDSASIRSSARREGDEYVLNGEKIFVTAGSRADAVVVWATVDPARGRTGIRSFVVERGNPGMQVVRLEEKLGIRASDTATIVFSECRIPAANLLGGEKTGDAPKGFAGVMQTFDNTRPLVAAMAIGVARAALGRTRELLEAQGYRATYDRSLFASSAVEAELYRMEADLEATWLLTLKAAWMADNGQPNSKEAAMAKAKAGRTANSVTLRCVELCSGLGYAETELLEKWARDSKILDIFEGTQQIQQLIIARRLLGKSSSELR
jgi:acyl-CoA dehydrogenase